MLNFIQEKYFLSLSRGDSSVQELKMCQKKTKASNSFYSLPFLLDSHLSLGLQFSTPPSAL